jgi:RNA polymerase sigma-70 factor (ECF subfamily)
MDRHRRGRREVAHPDPAGGVATEEGGWDSSLDGFEALISGLSDGVQTTLRLRFVEDLEYDAIARRLDCSPEAARQRVSSALRTLRTVHA